MISSSFPSKIQIGTLWLYLEEQNVRGENTVWKRKKDHKIVFFIIKPLFWLPTQLGFESLYANTHENSLLLFLSAYISMEKLFPHRLHHLCYTILLFCLGPHSHPCHQRNWVIHAATWTTSAMHGLLPLPLSSRRG